MATTIDRDILGGPSRVPRNAVGLRAVLDPRRNCGLDSHARFIAGGGDPTPRCPYRKLRPTVLAVQATEHGTEMIGPNR